MEGSVRLHLNSGERSLRLTNLLDSRHPEDSHVSCHKIEAANYNSVRLVTFVKSGCDSGFVCSEFVEEANGVLRVNLGQKSLLPSEACTQLYFSSSTVKSLLMVSRTSTTAPGCPMSGHYLVSPPSPALRNEFKLESEYLLSGQNYSRPSHTILFQPLIKKSLIKILPEPKLFV